MLRSPHGAGGDPLRDVISRVGSYKNYKELAMWKKVFLTNRGYQIILFHAFDLNESGMQLMQVSVY